MSKSFWEERDSITPNAGEIFNSVSSKSFWDEAGLAQDFLKPYIVEKDLVSPAVETAVSETPCAAAEAPEEDEFLRRMRELGLDAGMK